MSTANPSLAQRVASRFQFFQYAGVVVVVILVALLVMLLVSCRLYFCSQDGLNVWSHINFRADFIGSGVRELIPAFRKALP